MLFISDALAAAPATAAEPSALANLMPILLIGVVFYFFIIRPQNKKYKDHVNMVNSVSKGDKVVTSGGVIGTVTKVDAEKDQLQLEVAEGVKIKVVRSTIASVLRDTPVQSNDNKKAA